LKGSSLINDLTPENRDNNVQSYHSMYDDQAKVEHFRSKKAVSSTGCPPGEIVCVLRPKSVKEIFHMYGVVLEEFGVKIPFTRYEMDVLRFLNVVPT